MRSFMIAAFFFAVFATSAVKAQEDAGDTACCYDSQSETYSQSVPYQEPVTTTIENFDWSDVP